ncbi:MAG TPA: hypothetical protein VL098_12595 [Flavipsychrobacter sp.]|nr:hypothetical protein [Flavipsychrobacter sp.]
MFTDHFPYRKINFDIIDGVITHNFTFFAKSGTRYIVLAEQYDFFVFAVKFYNARHKNCSERFNRLTNKYECSRVITTVGHIMKDIFNNNPFASFAFIGSQLKDEGKSNTKRFRLYSRIIESLVAPLNFEHRPIPQHSAYIALNRHNTEPQLLEKIEQMFQHIFVVE